MNLKWVIVLGIKGSKSTHFSKAYLYSENAFCNDISLVKRIVVQASMITACCLGQAKIY